MEVDFVSPYVPYELWLQIFDTLEVAERLVFRQVCRQFRHVIDTHYKPQTLAIAFTMPMNTYRNTFRVDPVHQVAHEERTKIKVRKVEWKGPDKRDFLEVFSPGRFNMSFIRLGLFSNVHSVYICEGNYASDRTLFDGRLLAELPLLRNLQLINCNPIQTEGLVLPNVQRLTLMFTEWDGIWTSFPALQKFKCSLDDFQIFSEEYEASATDIVMNYLTRFTLVAEGHIKGDEIGPLRLYFPCLLKFTLITNSRRFTRFFPLFEHLQVLSIKTYCCWRPIHPDRFLRMNKVALRLMHIYRGRSTQIRINGFTVNGLRELILRHIFNSCLWAPEALTNIMYNFARADRSRSTSVTSVAWERYALPPLSVLKLPPALNRLMIKVPIEQVVLDDLPTLVPGLTMFTFGDYVSVEDRTDVLLDDESDEDEPVTELEAAPRTALPVWPVFDETVYDLKFILKFQYLTSLCIGGMRLDQNAAQVLIDAASKLKYLVHLEFKNILLPQDVCLALHTIFLHRAHYEGWFKYEIWFASRNRWAVFPDPFNMYTNFADHLEAQAF
jgi:hypothetical protein